MFRRVGSESARKVVVRSIGSRPYHKIPPMPIFLKRRLTGVRERMEAPDCDPAKLRRTYAQFRAINTLVSDGRPIYRRFLRGPAFRPAADRGPTTVLDIGFGGGDIPTRLARWAERDGLELSITAVDTDPRALDFVRRGRFPSNLTFRRASVDELLEAGERFDVVVSNHLLHHLTEPEIETLCDRTRRLARRRVVHSDIVRSDLAWLAFAALTAPFFHRSYIVADGLTSVRRSFTHRELRRLAPRGWRAGRVFPYHQLLIWPGDAGVAPTAGDAGAAPTAGARRGDPW